MRGRPRRRLDDGRLGESPQADVDGVWLDPPQPDPRGLLGQSTCAAAYAPLDPEAAKDIETLSKALSGDFTVVSRTLDDSRWIVPTDDPPRGMSSHLYDRGAER